MPTPQVLIEGGTHQTGETPATRDDVQIVVIDGTWELPPRGH
jgi:hypothetical protein